MERNHPLTSYEIRLCALAVQDGVQSKVLFDEIFKYQGYTVMRADR